MPQAQLYFEDIEVGEEIRPMYQYMDQRQLVNWAVASGNMGPGHYDMFHNRSTSGRDPSVTGQLKFSLMEKTIRSWAGPKIWVKKIGVRYREWDHFFEIKTFRGKVVDKYQDNGTHFVDLELTMERDDGKVTTMCKATVVVPSRS